MRYEHQEVMYGWILDEHRNNLSIMDIFESFIWTERYRGAGDFELYMPVNPALLTYLQANNYLAIDWSERMMILEAIEVKTDVMIEDDESAKLIVRGRSLESILDRRVIWNHTILTGNFQNGIHKLLLENIIAPEDDSRIIPNFIFRESIDPAITSLEIDAQFLGEDLYTVINSLCAVEEVGWRILPDGATGYIFELYKGVDRHYDQYDNNFIIFSPEYDNLLTSNYIESKKTFKNVARVGGEGQYADRVLASVGTATGLNRRETFVNATDVSRNITDDEGNRIEIPMEEYIDHIVYRGKQHLSTTRITKAFEGDVDATRQFIFGRDFRMGDRVQVMNEFGISEAARVTELIRSMDGTGFHTIPTFTFAEEMEFDI